MNVCIQLFSAIASISFNISPALRQRFSSTRFFRQLPNLIFIDGFSHERMCKDFLLREQNFHPWLMHIVTVNADEGDCYANL